MAVVHNSQVDMSRFAEALVLAAGHRQTLSKGDIWQLGGMMVVKPGNRLAYHYISEALGDFPPEKDLHA